MLGGIAHDPLECGPFWGFLMSQRPFRASLAASLTMIKLIGSDNEQNNKTQFNSQRLTVYTGDIATEEGDTQCCEVSC